MFAIKRIPFDPSNKSLLRKVIREIYLLRKLSAQQKNVYTTKLFDIIYEPINDHESKA